MPAFLRMLQGCQLVAYVHVKDPCTKRHKENELPHAVW